MDTAPRGSLGEPIACTVEGLPLNENAVISIRPGGWQVVERQVAGQPLRPRPERLLGLGAIEAPQSEHHTHYNGWRVARASLTTLATMTPASRKGAMTVVRS